MEPLSSKVYHIDNLIEYSFIAGITEHNLKNNNNDKNLYIPECLFSYPSKYNDKLQTILQYVFPLGIEPLPENSLENEESTDFTCFFLTNSKGKHSYVYELKFYDKVNNLKVPIAICLNSLINDTDSFKILLHEIYMIMISDLSFNSKKIELLHYFMFIRSIKAPPFHSLLSLNMKFLSVDFYFNSQCELPTVANDTNINILFSVLEMSKIIKVWLCVLFEKKIIIYGDKPYLLHAVIDAITKLIFPFNYPYNLISYLPKKQIEFLDSPFRYIIGVLSSTITIDQLKETYKDHCIVDLIPGRVYGSKTLHLPRDEEISIKKDLQFVRNPELFENNQIFKSDKKFLDKDCIDPTVNLSTNIKHIFFRVMKKVLTKYKNHIINNKFINDSFLFTIPNEEMRKIWEVIVKTNLFSEFYSKDGYLDDNNHTKVFNEILLNKDNKMTIDNAFKIKVNMIQLDQKKIIDRIRQYDLDDDNNTFEDIFMEYCNEERYDNKSNHYANGNQRMTLITNVNRNSIFNGNDSLLTDDIKKAQSTIQRNQVNHINELYDFNPTSLLVSSIRDTNSKNIYAKIPDNKFRFYHNDGFLLFMNNLLSKCDLKEKKLNDIIIEEDINNDIILLEKNFELNNNNNRISMNYRDSLDCISEFSKEQDCMTKNSEKYNSCFNNQFPYIKKVIYDSIEEKEQQSKKISDKYITNCDIQKERNSISNDKPMRISITQSTNKKIMSQEYLFFSFNLEHKDMSSDYKDKLLYYYNQAYELDQINFPYSHYSSFLNKHYTFLQLEEVEHNTQGNQLKRIIHSLQLIHKQKTTKIPKKPLKSKPKQIIVDDIKHCDLTIDHSKTSKTITSKKLLSFKYNMHKIVDFEKVSKEMKKELHKRRMNSDINFSIEQNYQSMQVGGKNNMTARMSVSFNLPSSVISFQSPQVINTQNKIYTRFDALTLIQVIGFEVNEIINKAGYYINDIYSYNSLFAEIQDLVNRLQKVNLAKLVTITEKYVFWLNTFNYLLIYAIIYSQYNPNNIKNWGILLKNCLFKIGGYEMSLYEIEHLILHCEKIHKVQINFTDSLMKKFVLEKSDPLISCALYFPIQGDIMRLVNYRVEDFDNQRDDSIIYLLQETIIYSAQTNILSVSSYLISLYPSFLTSTYELFKNYLDYDLYIILKEKKYKHVNITLVKWETIFK